MKVNRAFRYELKPNREQKMLLSKHAGCARFTYNWGLSERIRIYSESGKSTNAIEQHRVLNALKKTEYPWMYEVSKCAPQEALRDLDRAFSNFFNSLKGKSNAGFPKYKKKGIHDSFRLTGSIKVYDKAVQLPRHGIIRLKEKTDLSGRILSATVCREANRWYVSITVEDDIKEPELIANGEIVGIDVGLLNFAVMSNMEKKEAPKPLNKYLKKLKRKSREHSRKQKGSSNRKKSTAALARLHRKIKNIRMDFLHKLTTSLAKTKQEIVIEDLNIQGMIKNRHLSRSITDSGWGAFRRMLQYKTLWYGSKLTLAPKFSPSSKTCSFCGYLMPEMPLNIREWQCPNCGAYHDRDENAAKNLLKHAVTQQRLII